jgi:tetratricopeptide (TPR) repeat protein
LLDSKADSLEQLGACLLELRQTDDALPILQRVADLQPKIPAAQLHPGSGRACSQTVSGGRENPEPVVMERPKDSDALDLLAKAYEGMGNPPDAMGALRQAIISNPHVPQRPWFARARAPETKLLTRQCHPQSELSLYGRIFRWLATC